MPRPSLASIAATPPNTDFAGEPVIGPVDPSIEDQPATDPRRTHQVRELGSPLTDTPGPFSQSGEIGVILDDYRHAKVIVKPVLDDHVTPSWQPQTRP